MLSLNREDGRVIGKVPSGDVYVDGLGVGDVGNLLIKDRQQMAEAGVLVVSVAVDLKKEEQ